MLCVFVIGFIYQCKKKDNNEPIPLSQGNLSATTATSTPTTTSTTTTTTTTTTTASIDTIYPHSYFPAFPNSYWRYLNTNGDTSSSYTSNSYVLDNYTKPGYTVINASAYVPLYNGIPIWGYFEHRLGNYTISLYMPRILSDSLTVGTSWNDTYGANIIGSRAIKCLDTTIIINGISYDSTIVMEYSNQQASNPLSKAPYMRRYFTKNIGITREETLVIDLTSPLPYGAAYIPSVTKNLQSYFINH